MRFAIIVTATTPSGRLPLEVGVDAGSLKRARELAIAHIKKLGYDDPVLGFPDRPEERAPRSEWSTRKIKRPKPGFVIRFTDGAGRSHVATIERVVKNRLTVNVYGESYEIGNGGYRRVSKTEAAKYNLLSLAAKKLYQARHDPTCASKVGGKPPGYYRMVQTPGGVTLRMASHLADQWKALSPAQQRSLLWRATRNRTTTQGRSLPCR